MADRAPPPRAQQQPTTAVGGALNRPRTTGPAPSASTLASNVRRNLFQGNLTRRPTGGSASTSAETLRLDTGGGSGGDTEPPESSDIVVRDRNGEVQLGDPPLPVVDDAEEVAPDARQENEKERQRLADAVKQHRIDQNSVPAQPEELLEAVRASLRAKVAALLEDNWMYEREDLPRY